MTRYVDHGDFATCQNTGRRYDKASREFMRALSELSRERNGGWVPNELIYERMDVIALRAAPVPRLPTNPVLFI